MTRYFSQRYVTSHDETRYAALHKTTPCYVESVLCIVPCGGFCCRDFNAFAKIGVRFCR